MKQVVRLWRAEQVKSRRTSNVWMHLLVPIMISSLFLLYYSFSQVNSETKWEAFIQLLAIGFPFMISIVVSIAVDQERQNGFVALLAGIPNKKMVIVVKILRLFCLGSLSLACTFIIFIAGMYMQSTSPIDLMYCIISAAIIMLSVLLLYIAHWFVDLRFSRNYSIALGLVGSLIAAVFMTGLGDGLWPFAPSSWPVRYISYYMVYNQSTDVAIFSQIRQTIMNSVTIDVVITCISLITFFIWFKKWEGENADD